MRFIWTYRNRVCLWTLQLCLWFCTQILLFKNYLQWKCLHFWYKYISQNKYCRAREELQGPLSLFMLCPPLRDASLKVSALIYQTGAINLYNGAVLEENTLQGFKEQQVGINPRRVNRRKQNYDHFAQNWHKCINRVWI